MKYVCKNNYCRFENLPFYWHPLEDASDNRFPEFLPFELFYDKDSGLLRQRPDEKVTEIINSAYSHGSEIVGLLDEKGIGNDYARDFLKFIDRCVGLGNIAGKEVLEIGCGKGYLLSQLQSQGAKVLGYEPGFSKIGKYPVPVINDFFPSAKVKERKFDIIVAYELLEHAVDIDRVLDAIGACLKDNGILLVSVPDCAEHINNGDISMFIHEHFSYFTRDSLQYFMEKKGFMAKAIEKSGFGGCLYGAFAKSTSKVRAQSINKADLEKVFHRIDRNIQRMHNFILKQEGRELGVYVPIRALNILSLYRGLIEKLNVRLRFFDDSASLAGRYLPGFNIRIENRDSLIKNPPDVILVYSFTFAKKIIETLKNSVPKEAAVVSIEDL
ncbi:MAG: class I SAM-dependent methyltransferase [Candidatus Omnitrophica bacterium]|nr:class I SAM-dependent methyltransferase [Candidatus Omnitrophota bacterium]